MRSHVIVSKQTEVPEHDLIVNWFQRLGFDFNVSCIAIKPNLCCYRPSESGATTDPLLIRSIVRAIHFMNPHAKCVIVESNTWAVDADLAFSVLGYRRIVGKEPNTSFINLTKEVKQHIAFNGHFFNGFEAPLILHEADALISVPKLKTMVVDVMTGCLKNQFGCNPDPQKDKYHIHLSKVIADLNILFRPTISLVDGLLAQDVTGPAHGRIRKANLYIIGNDPVSVDTEILRVTNLTKFGCRHVRYAAKHGVGESQSYLREGDQVDLDFGYSLFRNLLQGTKLFRQRLVR